MSAQSTPNFIILDTDQQRIPGLIAGWVPGFEDTPEFTALADRDRGDPRAVCAALARLLVRLQGEDLDGSLTHLDVGLLEDVYKALERLARRDEASIRAALMSDILGLVKATADSRTRVFVKSQFGPDTRALFEQSTT